MVYDYIYTPSLILDTNTTYSHDKVTFGHDIFNWHDDGYERQYFSPIKAPPIKNYVRKLLRSLCM